jgi:hypothetical protein
VGDVTDGFGLYGCRLSVEYRVIIFMARHIMRTWQVQYKDSELSDISYKICRFCLRCYLYGM